MNNFSGSGKVCVAPKAGRTTMNTDFVKFIVQIERPKGNDGKESFDRINVGCWGKICKYAQYIEQGDIIEFTGPLSTTSYQKEGQWVNNWEISAKTIKILQKTVGVQQPSPVPAAQPIPQPAPAPVPPPVTVETYATPEESLPFDIMGGYYG